MFPFINESISKKIHPIKEKFDKFFTIIISSLCALSTLWDIILFHCYWSDYMLELYCCFFLTLMGLHFIIPAKIPKIIINNIGLIKIALGRSIIMIFFSLLFLGDEHIFHKIVSILQFIGGILLLIMEIISPENLKGKNYYESNENNNNNNERNNEVGNNDISQNDTNPPTKLDEDSQQNAPENLNNLSDLNNPEIISNSINNNESEKKEGEVDENNNNDNNPDVDKEENNDKVENNIHAEEK